MKGAAVVGEARPFNLSRWFAIAGLICVATISIAAALLLSRLVGDRLLRQDAELSMEFVQSVVLAEHSESVFDPNVVSSVDQLESLFNHVGHMPDVLRANIYRRDQTVLWSSDRALIGRRLGPNLELDESLEGELVVNSGETDAHGEHKAERDTMDKGAREFVELYLPIRAGNPERVVAVVEIYKTPRRLFELMHTLEAGIWTGAGIAGAFLFVALFSVVRRADNLIRAQQEKLVQSETLAVVGELGAAVAHGIRNPLAAIRSSAELVLEKLPVEAYQDSARDIIAETDRLDSWVHGLLRYARLPTGHTEQIDLGRLVGECFAGYARAAKQKQIDLRAEAGDDLPPIAADPMLLTQVIGNLIANALELSPPPRSIHGTVSHDRSAKCVVVSVRDDGPGMSEAEAARALKPFYTTKPNGLGLGLALAKRVVERIGGRIAIRSAAGQGAEIRLEFPVQN